MAASTTDALFVTANVGSIFEDPTSMLKIWCEEFLSTVSRLNPKLVALHCQEVGGKNYERSMQHVSEFVKLLMSSAELQHFDKVRIYLDEDYSSAEHFTALGNFYFIHESISDDDVQIFNFHENRFEPSHGKEVFSENIEDVATKEKSKFPQEIFPECKWSRKGFMRTRWNLNGTIFDLVNIHLFHDASNFVAMESFPSVYCQNRQRALEHTLKRFHSDQFGNAPFFVFGDFNFRTDTQGVVKKLSEGLNPVKVPSSKSTDYAKLQFKDESSQQVVLTLGKKEFSHQDHQKLFVGDESEWLREFDRELESFTDQLFEFNIKFPPSYPYVEDSERGELYMQTRCPSWCDRVFLSSNARELVDMADESTLEYGLIGMNACMGDHKPVFLRAALLGGLGTVSCCTLPAAPCTACFSTSSVEHPCPVCAEQSKESTSLPIFAVPKQDHSGLVVPKFPRHSSPYTPDSTDTEPDLGEEMSPNEESMLLKSKLDRRLNRFELPPRKRLQVTDEATINYEFEDNFSRGQGAYKSASKIPIRITEQKENFSHVDSHVSKIPVPKQVTPKQDKDLIMKSRNGRYSSLSVSSPQGDQGKLLTCKDDKSVNSTDVNSACKFGEICVGDGSLIPKPHYSGARKQLCRQMNIDEHSSDSDTASVDLMDDGYSASDQTRNKVPEEVKVEIQFSLVESSPTLLSPIDCVSDGLLTAKVHGLGGSTTDSGVSVSPDLSVAASPSTEEHGKIVDDAISNLESPEEDDSKTDIHPSSLERFSFVRRIQSASAMERKSSFPLPSTIFIENQSPLTAFGGSGSDLWGMRSCRCMSDGSWRQRSSTISHSMLSSRTDSRIRLISTSSHLDRSLPRLQSHHSSSDEEWFEEIESESHEAKKHEVEPVPGSCEAKAKRSVVDFSKRLSTHQECAREKNSDSNISSDNDYSGEYAGTRSLKQNPESVLQTQTFSEAECLKAIAAVGGTLANTCFVDTDRSVRGSLPCTKNITESEAKLNLHSHEREPQLSEPVESCPLVEKEHLQKESRTLEEENHLQPRRSSVTSRGSKAQNTSSCKACCSLM